MKTYQDRINCWKHTQMISHNLPSDESVKYYLDENFEFNKNYNFSQIQVVREDPLDCAIKMIHNSYDPAILSFADDSFPGGSIDIGGNAQEENIFRRSNYHNTLKENFYPLKHDECVYSPNVWLLKLSDRYNWNMLQQPMYINLIACTGIKSPKLLSGHNDIKMFNKSDENIFLNKIRMIFQTAYVNNHNSLILGALSCGPLRGPVEHIANLFKRVIQEYDGMFKTILFAIPCETPEYFVRRNNQNIDIYTIFSQILFT